MESMARVKIKVSIYFPLVDPRVDGWLFMDSPWPTFFLCISYVLLVKWIGPRYMKNRAPFDLRRLLVFYNAAQVIFSTWLFYEVRSSVSLAAGSRDG